MDDLIKRSDVFEALDLCDFVRDNEYEDGACLLFRESVIDRVDEIPIVQGIGKGEWIDAKEQLPGEERNMFVSWATPNKHRSSSYVLVTIKDYDVYAQGFRKIVTIARYDYTYERWVVRSGREGEILAWMPLPKPYKGEER